MRMTYYKVQDSIKKILTTFMVLFIVIKVIFATNVLFGPIAALVPLNIFLYIIIFKKKKSNVVK